MLFKKRKKWIDTGIVKYGEINRLILCIGFPIFGKYFKMDFFRLHNAKRKSHESTYRAGINRKQIYFKY